MSNPVAYEDKSDDIDLILKKYRAKWQLDAITWMDYDDVCQTIRLHIFNKWHLWDQTKPFAPWAATVASNQIKNMIRNNYSNYARPCLRCEHFLGGDGCGLLSNHIQGPQCPLYAKWMKKKANAFNLKMPVPIENASGLSEIYIEEHIDMSKSQERMHEAIMAELSPKHALIYRRLFMDGSSHEDVAKEFGFKADSDPRKTKRYKHISNLKKRFYDIGRRVISEQEIL